MIFLKSKTVWLSELDKRPVSSLLADMLISDFRSPSASFLSRSAVALIGLAMEVDRRMARTEAAIRAASMIKAVMNRDWRVPPIKSLCTIAISMLHPLVPGTGAYAIIFSCPA